MLNPSESGQEFSTRVRIAQADSLAPGWRTGLCGQRIEGEGDVNRSTRRPDCSRPDPRVSFTRTRTWPFVRHLVRAKRLDVMEGMMSKESHVHVIHSVELPQSGGATVCFDKAEWQYGGGGLAPARRRTCRVLASRCRENALTPSIVEAHLRRSRFRS